MLIQIDIIKKLCQVIHTHYKTVSIITILSNEQGFQLIIDKQWFGK